MELSENVLKLSDLEIQKALHEIDGDCLVHVFAYLLNDKAKEKILKNMSEKAKIEINNDIKEYQKKMNKFMEMIKK